MEKPIRSLLKAISWRIVATLTTILLVFVYTGNLVLSGSVGFLELLTKFLFTTCMNESGTCQILVENEKIK